MKKKLFYSSLLLSMLLGGFSYIETQKSTNLLISENVEALTDDGNLPENAILLDFREWKLVNIYTYDPTGNSPKGIVADRAFHGPGGEDLYWYTDGLGMHREAHKCFEELYSVTIYTNGRCYAYQPSK